MKLFKLLMTIMLLLFLVSCATPKPVILLESGRPLANPNYVLRDTGGTEMLVTFWFTAFTTVIDRDGATIHIPHTLTMEEVNMIENEIVKLTVTVEVFNPHEIEYRLGFDIKSQPNNGRMMGVAAVSEMMYRLHTLNMPIDGNIKSAVFLGNVANKDGDSMFTLGPFQYQKGG